MQNCHALVLKAGRFSQSVTQLNRYVGFQLPAYHTPVRYSSDTTNPVSLARNLLPPFCTVLALFHSEYIFEVGVLSLQVAADIDEPP